MKKLLIAIVAAGLCASAFAQVPTFAYNTLSVPATVPAATQTNIPFATAPVIDCRKQQKVTLSYTSRLADLGSNVVLVLAPSVDGINYQTNTGAGILAANERLVTITFTNDIVVRTLTTNLDCSGGIGYWKLLSIYNKEGANVLTNLSVSYGIKISSP